MKIEAKTPTDYIDQLPEDRQKAFRNIRALIRKSLPKGYKESIKYGMIHYEVPLKKNGSPNVSLSFGNQKAYMAMYFSNIYDGEKGEKKFRQEYEKDDYKLNMGRSCLRFKSVDELNIEFLEKLLSGKLTTPFH